jgi:hypothetical protein
MIEAFKNPMLDKPSPIKILSDGTVYGHVADWNGTHIGRLGVKPPRNHTDYRYFHLGAYLHGEKEIDVGCITLHTQHSDLHLTAEEARRAYEDTGAVAAYIKCGEDQFGIWFSGKLAKGLDEADVEALRGSKVSGDWRGIGGKAELIGVLAVNIPGFPIERERVLVAAGQRDPLALVACGAIDNPYVSQAQSRLRVHLARRKLASALNRR